MKTRSLRELCLKVNTAPEDFFSEDMRDIGKKYIESRLNHFCRQDCTSYRLRDAQIRHLASKLQRNFVNEIVVIQNLV